MQLAAKGLPKSGMLFLLLMGISACSSNLADEDSTSVSKTSTSAEEKNPEVLEYEILPSLPITLVDHLGNEVTVELTTGAILSRH